MVGLMTTGITQGLKTAMGLGQLVAGASMGKTERPEYYTSDALAGMGDVSAMAKRYAEGQLPGMAYARTGLQSAQSQALSAAERAASDPSQMLAMAASSQAQTGGQVIGLEAQEAQQRAAFAQQYMSQKMNELRTRRQDEQAAWDWNIKQPYEAREMQRQALISGGLQNAFGGAQDLASTFTGAEMGLFGQGAYERFGGEGANPFQQMQAMNPSGAQMSPLEMQWMAQYGNKNAGKITPPNIKW